MHQTDGKEEAVCHVIPKGAYRPRKKILAWEGLQTGTGPELIHLQVLLSERQLSKLGSALLASAQRSPSTQSGQESGCEQGESGQKPDVEMGLACTHASFVKE